MSEKDPLVPHDVAAGRERFDAAAEKALSKSPAWKKDWTTVSGAPVVPLAGPDTQPGFDFERDLGWPGEYPYTRGVHPTGYRGKLWTMRQFAGYGTAKQTNERFHYLLDHGQTGLSTAFHLPTLYGYDSDHYMARGEVGKCGVAIDSLRDMEVLFDRIDLGKVTTSMTINSTAPIALAMYLAVAEKHGTPWEKVGGTLQNDILKEYIAQKEYIFPPRPSMRLITDQFSFCAKHVPKWNTISISGYHIREAGSTALQELAFTLRDGVEYVQYGIEAGLPVDEFAPRLSFFFNSHNDFFEEIAKFRAARRIWSKTMRERFGAKDPRSWMCRFHTQTAGCSLTAQQPYNNVVRTAIQALAGVLGGTNSLHTNSLDETLALPTDFAVKLALRTQQVIAHESGVANTIDPLAGSYFIEDLTTKMERGCFDYFRRIDELGGMVEAIEAGFPAARDHGRRLRLPARPRLGREDRRRRQRLRGFGRAAARDALHRRRRGGAAEGGPRGGPADPRRQGRHVGPGHPAPGLCRRQERHAAAGRSGEDLRHRRGDLRRDARSFRDIRGARRLLNGVRPLRVSRFSAPGPPARPENPEVTL